MAEEKITTVAEDAAVEKKAPAKKAAAKPAAASKAVKKAPAKATAGDAFNIKLTKSLIGRSKKQIATANSLGLKRVGDTTVQPNNVATTGKIKAIAHMIEIAKA